VPARSLTAPSTLAALLTLTGLARAQPAPADPPAPAPAATGAAVPPPSQPPPQPPRNAADPIRPPPLHAEFAQYGVGINAVVNVSPGATCGASVRPGSTAAPCILGSGGGLVIRGGYRAPGPWYIGGAYAFAKLDSSNLYRLGIFQQAWAEMRWLPDTGYRAAPYATWGLGGVAYGNEWGVETGGAMLFGGGGVQFEVSRLAVVGLGFVYKPTLIAGWTDTADIKRPIGVAHFLGLEVQLEVRTELGRR
jgi:hypothetical protein